MIEAKIWYGKVLLNALVLLIPAYEGIENGQDVTAVFNHAGEDIAQFRFAFGVAMPLCQDGRGHLNVPAQLFRGVSTKEQAIEKRGLALRKFKFRGEVHGNELCHRGHTRKVQFTQKCLDVKWYDSIALPGVQPCRGTRQQSS